MNSEGLGAAEPSAGTGAERVLVIDDERRILNFVSRGLRAEGYEVDVADDGQAGLAAALARPYDLVILDLLMPGMDGREVIRRLMERRPRQTVIVLSCLTDTESKVDSLELGADDYLAKPFSFDELLARVRARLRGARRPPAQMNVGALTLDPVRRVADAGSGPVPLAEREFLLLQELMRSPGQILSKERLLSAVWGYHFDPASNVVDVYVGRLRAKLGTQTIATHRGKGYCVDTA
ncbi:MAG TPA: response regulator transcription factor [Actinomycetota bacterium]|jgi:DNA-binding response OmpR family regulator